MTYAAPLFVTAEFTNNTTGEIKSQTVFMGDFPVMTDKGTFIINGTERVVVSQLVRSPGVYFDHNIDKTTEKDVYSVKIIPSRGAWLEFDVDKRDTVGVRIDRKRRQPVTVLLKALGWTNEQIQAAFRVLRDDDGHPGEGPHGRPGRGPARHLPQAAPGRAAHPGERADAAGEPVLQGQALRPGEGRPVQGQQEARPDDPQRGRHADRGGHRHHHRVPRPAARRRHDDGVRRGRGSGGLGDRDPGRDRRHRPLRQPAPAHRGRADPEPDPGRPLAHGARRPRADDHPGRRGDHAADPDQHPAGRGGDQGVLRHLAAVAVHGPDQPAGRPDAQAASVRAGPGRSVPRAGGLRGPRRAPQPLRPHVPDRDPGRPEHRPDRVAVELRAGQPVRLHPDAVPQGRGRHRAPSRSTT